MIDLKKAKQWFITKNGLYEKTFDSRQVFTEFGVAEELISQVNLGFDNLVFNLEFIFVLENLGEIDTVWFATVCDKQAAAAVRLGVDPARIIRYKYEELDRFPTDMKFDAVIANPPYEKTKWVEFIELGYRITKKGGWVGFITPRWSLLPRYDKTRRLVFSMSEVKVIKQLLSSSFMTKRNGEFDQIRSVPQYFVAKVGNPTEKQVEISREWKYSDEKFVSHWDVVDYDKTIPSLFGDKGLEVIDITQSLSSANVVIEKERSRKNVPAVYSGVKHAGTYWGYNRSPSSKLMSGLVLDVDGSKGNPDRGNKPSTVWYCNSQEHAQNMFDWLSSDAMKLYMSQIDGGSDHVKGNFHLYPDCPITDRRATIEEMYKAAGMSDELIEWVGQMCARPEK